MHVRAELAQAIPDCILDARPSADSTVVVMRREVDVL